MTSLTRRGLMAATAIAGVGIAAPTVLRAQGTVIRWGEMLPATHPQALMIDRIAATVAEQSDGRIEIQSFPNGQLGSGKDMMDSVVSGALAMTTDGAAALGSRAGPSSRATTASAASRSRPRPSAGSTETRAFRV